MDTPAVSWDLSIDGLTSSMTSQVVVVAAGVAATCFVLNLGYNYLKNGFDSFISSEGSSKFPDYEEIARCFILILAISLYLPFATMVVGFMDSVNKATTVNQEFVTQYTNEARKSIEEQTKRLQDPEQAALKDAAKGKGATAEYAQTQTTNNPPEEKGVLDKIADATGFNMIAEKLAEIQAFLNPTTLVSLALHSVFLIIVSIIQMIVLGIASFLTKVLIIIGPLAFAFSILPVFKNQLSQWFGTLITTGMTFTTCNILNGMTAYMFAQMLGSTWNQTTVSFETTLAFDIIMIVLYCSAFWITSKYVGKGDAGRMITKLVGAATAAAAMTFGGAAAAAGSAGSGAKVGAAAQAGKSIIEDGGE